MSHEANCCQASENVAKAIQAGKAAVNIRIVDALEIGTAVEVGPAGDSFEATITGICVYSHGVEYQCAWWNAKARTCEWLKASEVRSANVSPRFLIGFKR